MPPRRDAAAERTSSNSNSSDGSQVTNESPVPSSSTPSSQDDDASYTLSHLLIDLSPLALYALLYVWMLGRGWRVIPALLLLVQLAGAAYVFYFLRREMQPKHWAKALAGVGPQQSSSSSPLSPSSPDDEASSPSPSPPAPPSLPPQRKKKARYFELVAAQKVNPFLHPAWKIRSQLERVRISVMAVTLVPLRAISAVAILLLTCGALKLALLGVPAKDVTSKPLAPSRALLLSLIIRSAARALLASAFGYVRGVSLTEVNPHFQEVSPERAPIIVANHQTFVDPLLLFTSYYASAVGAIDNLRAPVIGTICQAIQTITVDRRDERSRHTVVEEIKARAGWGSLSTAEREAAHGPGTGDRHWPQIMLFPEGTCTNGRALIGFKQGAFVAKRPVQPLLISYLPYPAHRFHPCWVSAGPNILVMILRLFSEPVNRAQVEFLPVIAPTEEESAPGVDCSSFARRVRKAMADRLGVPVTEHTYEDVVLQTAALDVRRKNKKQQAAAAAKEAAAGQSGALGRQNSVTNIPNSLVGDPSMDLQLAAAAASEANSSPIVPATPANALPLLTSSIEVSTLQRLFQCDLDTIQNHLVRFQNLDVRRQGCLSYNEFLRFFEVDPAADEAEGSKSAMRQLFSLLDEDDSGSIDFREFLVGLSLLAESEGKGLAKADEATLRLAFDMFADESGETVLLSDLQRVFKRAFPAVSDSVAEKMFAEAAAHAATNHSSSDAPLQTPGGTEARGLSWPEFVEFCRQHPECVQKFTETILKV